MTEMRRQGKSEPVYVHEWHSSQAMCILKWDFFFLMKNSDTRAD